jgi:hypothetical protein
MRKINVLICLIVLSGTVSFAQTTVQVRDFETWTGVGLQKKFNKKFKIGLEQQFRFYDNSSSIDQYFTNFSLDYKPMKYLTFSGGMRFIRDADKDDKTYDNHLRFNGDVSFKHSLDRVSFKYRLRLQTNNELGFSRTEGDFLRNKVRLKAELKYNIPSWKLDPEFSTELFRESGRYMISSFQKVRFTFGTKYQIGKFGTLGLFYRMERELGGSYPQTTNILGARMIFEL